MANEMDKKRIMAWRRAFMGKKHTKAGMYGYPGE